MKVSELLNEKREPTDKGYYTPGYRDDKKLIVGTVQDWLARLKVEPEHIKQAMELAKDLPSYKDLVSTVKDITSTSEAKNGTFSFKRPSLHSAAAKYHVHANGLIRQSDFNEFTGVRMPTRMTSPKPHIVAGDPVKSLVAIYNTAFKALAEKAKKAHDKVNDGPFHSR